LVGFVIGFSLVFYLRDWRFALISVSAIPFLFAAQKKGKGALIAFLAALILGAGFGSIHPSEKKGSVDLTGMVIRTKSDYFLFESGGVRYYIYAKENTREIGDWVEIKGYSSLYSSTEYESRFSFSEYLKSQGVNYSIYVDEISDVFAMPVRFRQKEISFLENFNPLTGGAIDSLLFGHKDYSNDLIEGAAGIGALYFLSASGVLYGGFLRAIEWLFGLHFEKKKSRMIVFFVALLFLPILIFKIGVWRVFINRSIYLWADLKKKDPPNRFISNAIAGLILLFADRYNALDYGFLIGFGLAFSSSLTNDFLNRFQGRKKKLAHLVFNLLFLFPVLVAGNAIHFFAYAYSFFFLPLIYPFVFIALISFFTLPYTGFLQGYSKFLLGTVGFVEKVDLALPVGDWGPGIVFVYYGTLSLAFFFLESGFVLTAKKSGILLATLIVLNALPFYDSVSQEVSFINVGQGDAILIRDGLATVMIDTGGSLSFDLAREVDIPFLRKERIFAIDCLIASHGDYDHIGAASSLIDNYWVKKYIDDASDFPLTVGRMKFENLNVFGGSEENEESLVLTLDFMGKKWLFTGDAPSSIETKILQDNPDLNIDVLKVGHHGSKSSSSEAFLKAISPEVAIISVGKKNSYGHPDEETLKRFQDLGIPVRRTDMEGTISFAQFSSLW
jgi:competence protein ComEC